MPSGVPAHPGSETDAAEPNPMLVFRAHVLRDASGGTLANGTRAFLVYVDGAPWGWRFARSGRAAEARTRRARRIPADDAARVRAVWVPAAPLVDLVRVLRTTPGCAARRRDIA